MIGKLQTNKVKYAVKLFDFIHSVDSEKLIKKISEEQYKVKRKIKAEGVTYKTCTTCKGSGQVTRVTNTILGRMQSSSTCPTCGGSGQMISNRPSNSDILLPNIIYSTPPTSDGLDSSVTGSSEVTASVTGFS